MNNNTSLSLASLRPAIAHLTFDDSGYCLDKYAAASCHHQCMCMCVSACVCKCAKSWMRLCLFILDFSSILYRVCFRGRGGYLSSEAGCTQHQDIVLSWYQHRQHPFAGRCSMDVQRGASEENDNFFVQNRSNPQEIEQRYGKVSHINFLLIRWLILCTTLIIGF